MLLPPTGRPIRQCHRPLLVRCATTFPILPRTARLPPTRATMRGRLCPGSIPNPPLPLALIQHHTLPPRIETKPSGQVHPRNHYRDQITPLATMQQHLRLKPTVPSVGCPAIPFQTTRQQAVMHPLLPSRTWLPGTRTRRDKMCPCPWPRLTRPLPLLPRVGPGRHLLSNLRTKTSFHSRRPSSTTQPSLTGSLTASIPLAAPIGVEA